MGLGERLGGGGGAVDCDSCASVLSRLIELSRSGGVREQQLVIRLHHWSEEHRLAFVAMHADPDVIADLGGPFEAADAHAKFDRYAAANRRHGIARWAVVGPDDAFLGYADVMQAGDAQHPLGVHHEIGWRFRRAVWGRGFATESAYRALDQAWSVLQVTEIFAYTAADNLRSRAVMARLDLWRDTARDFTATYPYGD